MKKTLNKESNDSKELKLPKIINNKPKIKSPNQNRIIIKSNSTLNIDTNRKNESKNKSNSKIKINTSRSKKYNTKNNKNNLKIIASLPNINQAKISEEKLKEYKEKRKKRLKEEKKEEERGLKIYEEVLKEIQEKKKIPRTKRELTSFNSTVDSKMKEINNIEAPKIRISEKKAHTILEEGGMFDAYKYLLEQLCKNGLPPGNIFEYAAYIIENYEKKWKEKKYKLTQEKVEKYWKDKKEQIEKDQNLKNSEIIKTINRSLEEREINKIIKSLDRSRSSRHYQSFAKFDKKKSDKLLIKFNNKNILSVEQRGGEEKNKNRNENKNIVSRNSLKERNSIMTNKSGKEDDKLIKSIIKFNNKLISPLRRETKRNNNDKKNKI